MRSDAAAKGVLLTAGAAAVISIAAARLDDGSGAARAALVLLTLVKVALLGAAARWSLASRSRLEAGHLAVRAWGLLGAGFAGLATGHLVLGVEQLAIADLPFPSVSDAFFITSQVLLVAGLIGFVGAYRASGLFSEERAWRAWVSIGAVALVTGGVLVGTIVRLPVPWPTRATDGLYAVLDLATLVPLGLLVRQARKLGGRVGRVWALLLAGFAVFSVADVTFGYLNALDAEPSLLLSQFPFIIAYGLVAAGSRLQLALIAD